MTWHSLRVQNLRFCCNARYCVSFGYLCLCVCATCGLWYLWRHGMEAEIICFFFLFRNLFLKHLEISKFSIKLYVIGQNTSWYGKGKGLKITDLLSKHEMYFLIIIIIAFYQLDAKILYFNTFITFLYMFRALLCSSSGGQIVLVQRLVSSLSLGDCSVHRFRESPLKLCTEQSPKESDDTRYQMLY